MLIRDSAIDLVRGGAVLLVVFMHSTLFVYDPTLNYLNYVVAPVRMPLLMFVSGYLATRALGDSTKIMTRLANLFWPYIIWTSVIIIATGVTISEFIVPTSTLWFIWSLMIMTLSLLVGNVLLLLVGAAVLSMLSHSGLLAAGLYTVDHALSTGVFFYLGAVLFSNIRVVTTMPLKAFGQVLVALAVCRVIDAASEHYWGWQLAGIPERLLATIVVLRVAGAMCEWRVCTPIVAIGRDTLPIFVMHGVALFFLNPAVLALTSNPYVVALALWAGSILASIALAKAARLIGADWLYTRPNAVSRKAVMRLFATRIA